MYMERNEAPLPSSERDQRTKADERTRRELGSRAVADQSPRCGHELDLPPPRQGHAEAVTDVETRNKRASNPDWGNLAEEFSVSLGGVMTRVKVFSKPVTRGGQKWYLYTTVDADDLHVINAEMSPA